jgi:hypothetical protein
LSAADQNDRNRPSMVYVQAMTIVFSVPAPHPIRAERDVVHGTLIALLTHSWFRLSLSRVGRIVGFQRFPGGKANVHLTRRGGFNMSVFTACMVAFATCLILLSVMAVVMAILTRIFPAPLKMPASQAVASDAGVESAIAQAVTQAFPGARVSGIRELKR